MSITILVPHHIAERCYLKEALLWASVRRFPLLADSENGCDAREDGEYIEGMDPHLPFDEPVNEEECTLVGLPPNPKYEELVSGDCHLPPETLRQILKRTPVLEEERTKWQAELVKSIAFHKRQAQWNAQFEMLVDECKARIFLALREGRITAAGRRLPKATRAASLRHLESKNWDYWDEAPWVAIPHDFWIFKGIDWDESSAEGLKLAYCLILVDTEELLESFPPPAAVPYGGVARVANDLILASPNNTASVMHRTRGRPALDWESFHVEVARRVGAGGLPRKQEALIAEMQAWCKLKWQREVGRSTLLQKLKPYYDTLVRKSHNRD
jgi:hypothetical protein